VLPNIYFLVFHGSRRVPVPVPGPVSQEGDTGTADGQFGSGHAAQW